MLRTSLVLSVASLLLTVVACTGGAGAPGSQQNPFPNGRGTASGSGSAQGIDDGDDDDDDEVPVPGLPPTGVPQQPRNISASDYDQGCERDSDCMAVYEGDLCGGGSGACPNAAVSSAGFIEYTAAKIQRQVACGSAGSRTEGDCVGAPAGCDPNTKKCALNVTSGDGG